MADAADIAADIIETDLSNTIRNISRIEVPSLYDCAECGDPIPEQRRKLGSVTLCFGCQTELEAKHKHLRRS